MNEPNEAPPAAPEATDDNYFDNLVADIAAGTVGVEPEVPPAPEEPKVEEPEKPPEEAPKDEEIPEAPESLSAKAKADWEGIRETARNYKAKVDAATKLMEAQTQEWAAKEVEWQQKIEEASATSGELVELREKREAFEAAEREFSVYSVTKTAEYKKTIEAPLLLIEERIKGIAKKAEISADDLLTAVSELDDDKQAELLEAAVSGLGPVDAARVLRMAEDARGLILRDIEIRENAQAAQKELKERSEKETAAQREAAAKEYKASVKNTVDSLLQRLPFVELADGETKEGVFKSILDKAEAEDFDKATPATKGTAAVSVVALERATRQLQKQAEYIAQLEARVKQSTTTAPALGDGDPPKVPAAKESDDFMDGVNGVLGLQRSHTIQEALAAI